MRFLSDIKKPINPIKASLVLALLLILAALFFSYKGTWHISPWHDELWNLYSSHEVFKIDTQTSSTCSRGQCLKFLGLSLPLLSGNYHGAIKTILYSPMVFTGNPAIIRLCNILIFLLPLVLFYRIRDQYGLEGFLFIASVYLGLSPSLFFDQIYDHGPLVIPNLLLTTCVTLYFLDYRKQNFKYVAMGLACAILALYEKLTNIPSSFVLALYGTGVLLASRQFRLLAYSSLSGLPFLAFINFALRHPKDFFEIAASEHMTYGYNLIHVFRAFLKTYFSWSATIHNLYFIDAFFFFGPLCTLIAIGLLILSVLQKRIAVSKNSKFYILTCLIPVAALLTYPFFDGFYRPWHLYQMHPIVILFFMVCCVTLQANPKPVFRNILFCLPLILLVPQTTSIAAITVSSQPVHPFDNQLMKLAEHIKTRTTTRNLVCFDYSVCCPLALLLGPNYKILGEYPFTPIGKDIDNRLRDLSKQDYLLIGHRLLNDADQPVTDIENYDLFYARTHYFLTRMDSGLRNSHKKIELPNELKNYLVYFHPAQTGNDGAQGRN